MDKIRNLFRRFQFKVTIAVFLSMLVVTALSNILIYKFTLDSQLNGLRERLMVIARTAGLLIDADMLMQVPLNPEGINTPQYQTIAQSLKKIKEINPHIKYIYTMTKTDQEGIWQFLVDPDMNVATHRKDLPTSLPGDKYNAARFPEMLKSFDGPAADKNLEIDEWGITLSGYAPIRDKEGKAVAVLGVDISADDVYLIEREVHRRTFLVLVMGIFISLVVGMFISKRITDPVEELVEGTRHLAKGNLLYQVTVKGNDEISELAASFNQMAKSLEESRRRILGYFYGVVRTLVRILELRDQYTRGHSETVAVYAGKIATRMGFSQETVKMFKRMALLHDIGKLGIQDSILNKPGKLTPEEWDIIKKHTIIGEDILKPVLEDAEMMKIVRGHHERYDGTGYPDKLKSDQISIFASIVSVADAYDAMTSDRAYRPAMSKDAAIAELKAHSGTQFNPKIVEVFLQILETDYKSDSNKK